MNLLSWNDTEARGFASKDGVTYSLTAKPSLSFAFTALYYEPQDGNAWFFDGTNRVDLTDAQQTECSDYAAQKVDYQLSLVLGVDQNGAFLGRVESANAYQVVQTAPPNGDSWVYDFTSNTWKYVYGVDANGKYLGNVPVGSYTYLADSQPPASYSIWDNTQKAWVDGRSLAERQSAACLQIDQMASNVCAKYVSQGVAMDNRYWDKYQDALDYKNAGYPTPIDATLYAYIYEESTRRLVTGQAVADSIISQRHQWKPISAKVEGIRISAKEQVNLAQTVDAVEQAVNSANADFAAL